MFKLASPHFARLLIELLAGFAARYLARACLEPGPPDLEDHTWMMERLQEALRDETWRALKDVGEAQLVQKPKPEAMGLKRKSKMSEYDGGLDARRKRVCKALQGAFQ